MSVLRIGAGAGFSGDRIAPAIELAEKGNLDFLVFECLAERTIALAQQARLKDPAGGFDPMLERRMRAVLPITARNGTRIVTNMGAANPQAAARLVQKIASELGLHQLRIAAVTGDDVLQIIGPYQLDETGDAASALGDRLVSANAYIGIAPIVAALDAGADVVICGRASDPALFLAPLVHHFRWSMSDWTRLGRGILVGHLLECSAQVTGGYFADPGFKDVPNLARIGFPLAEVSEDGNAVITKVAGSGGCVTRATCTEQLLYEIHDPSEYLQPDVVADFSNVTIQEIAPDRVAISGAEGRAATGLLKISIGYRDGWKGEGQISYAGANCLARADLAAKLVQERLQDSRAGLLETRYDLIGHDSVPRVEGSSHALQPHEVRMRFAARCKTMEIAEMVTEEIDSLYLCGPAGGGGVTRTVVEIIAIAATLMPARDVPTGFKMLETQNAAA